MPSEQEHEYRESLPPERQRYWDAVTGRPYIPRGSSAAWKPRHGLILGGACLMGLYWFSECLEFLLYLAGVLQGSTPLRKGDSWFGLAFAALIFGLVAWYCIWEIKESAKRRE